MMLDSCQPVKDGASNANSFHMSIFCAPDEVNFGTIGCRSVSELTTTAEGWNMDGDLSDQRYIIINLHAGGTEMPCRTKVSLSPG